MLLLPYNAAVQSATMEETGPPGLWYQRSLLS